MIEIIKRSKYTIENLENLRYRKLELKRLEENLENFKSGNYRSPNFDSEIIANNPLSNKVEEFYLKQLTLEHDYLKFKEQIAKEIYEIEQLIELLTDGLHRVILKSYFIDNKTLEQIAEKTNYSRIQIVRRKKEAVSEFKEILKN